VIKPERSGFGTRLIERVIASEFGGRVAFDFNEKGVVCTIVIPLSELT
jgi:two-component sensor histidine kinase